LTLLAFAAECRAAERRAAAQLLPGARRCRSTSPASRHAHTNKPNTARLGCGARWDRQTNRRVTDGHRVVT